MIEYYWLKNEKGDDNVTNTKRIGAETKDLDAKTPIRRQKLRTSERDTK